jgi:hypothetical protein
MERSADDATPPALLRWQPSAPHLLSKEREMYLRIVTFGLAGITEDQYEAVATDAAPGFRAWPGLQAKWWLADRDHGVFGGVYVFDSKDAADASRSTELFQALTANPALADVTIREFDTLPAPTAVTTGG